MDDDNTEEDTERLFNRADYRFKTADPGFDLDGDEHEDKALKKLGKACPISEYAKKHPMRPCIASVQRPTSAELEQWATGERPLAREAQKGDKRTLRPSAPERHVRLGNARQVVLRRSNPRQWAAEEHVPSAPEPPRELVIQNEAARELVLRHLFTLQVRSWRRWRKLNPAHEIRGFKDLMPFKQERALQHDDFVAAALERFWFAVDGYNSRYALDTYARYGVFGALSDTARDWRNKSGLGGTNTRIQRFLRSGGRGLGGANTRIPRLCFLQGGGRWAWPADWIRLKFPKFSLEEIEWEKKIAHAIQEAETYDEGAVDDELESDDEQSPETTDFEAARQSPAISEWSRESGRGYQWPVAKRGRNGRSWLIGYTPAHEPKPIRVYGSLWNDRSWEYCEYREQLRIKLMGRQGYADWLVERSRRQLTVYQVRNGKMAVVYTDKGTVVLQAAERYRLTPRSADNFAKIIALEKKAKSDFKGWTADLHAPLVTGSSFKNKKLLLPTGQAPVDLSSWNPNHGVYSRRRGFDFRSVDETMQEIRALENPAQLERAAA